MRCPTCGVETGDTSALCVVCGSYVVTRPSVAADEVAGSQGSRAGGGNSRRDFRKAFGFGFTLLVIIIGIIAGGLRSSSHSSSSHQSSSHQLSYTQLSPGDCLEGSNLGLGTDSPWPAQVTGVPCTHRHLAEVFFSDNIWSQSLAYPGSIVIANQGYARCLSAFRAYDGIAQSASAFSIAYTAPDAATWPTGDRQVICVAYQADPVTASGVSPVDYSIRGSHR